MEGKLASDLSPTEGSGPHVEVVESYGSWVSPVDLRGIVSRILSDLPSAYLAALRAVVLTASPALNRDRRRQKTWFRGRKVLLAEARGCYHQAWKGQPAWIELFADNLLEGFPKIILNVPFLRDMIVSSVLLHELGHHLHTTQTKEHTEREDVAERWRRRLGAVYMRKRYWYLMPLLAALRWLRIGWLLEKMLRWAAATVRRRSRATP